MAGLASSERKPVRTAAKAAAKKWSSLVPARAKVTPTGHASTTRKRQLPSVAETSSDEEEAAVVVKPVKKARVTPEVEDEVVINEQEDVEESEDVVELENDDEMEEGEVSPYPHV